MIGSFFQRFRRSDIKPSTAYRVPSAEEVAALLKLRIDEVTDVWIAQAESLQQLRKYGYARRKLEMAATIALEGSRERPDSPGVWFTLGKIYLALNQPDKADLAFRMMDTLARSCGDKRDVKLAQNGLARSSRLRTTNEQSLADKVAEAMFYTCQSCGHPILFLGTHCPHCRFAPSTNEEVAIGIILSTLYLDTSSMLNASREIQRGRKPNDFMPQLHEMIPRIDDGGAVLSKLEQSKADDHLDFRLLEACHQCGTAPRQSWAHKCLKCGEPLNRPDLVELAICIDRAIQHFVWNIRRDSSESFSDFVTLLVNVKSKIIRDQTGPTESQRKWARKLLVGISPIYTDNGGGVIEVKSEEEIHGKVLDPSVHPQIELTIDHIEGELRNFARLISDQVSLF